MLGFPQKGTKLTKTSGGEKVAVSSSSFPSFASVETGSGSTRPPLWAGAVLTASTAASPLMHVRPRGLSTGMRKHGLEAPQMAQMTADGSRRLPVPLSAPIRVICGQDRTGSNQPLEPMETGGAVEDTAALMSCFSSGLHGSVLRSPSDL